MMQVRTIMGVLAVLSWMVAAVPASAQVQPIGELPEDVAATGDSQSTNVTEFIPLPVDDVEVEGATAQTNAQSLISISLDDVELVDVVRMFSRISGANIIATPSNLTAHVTANLDGVEWKPALTSILAMHNLALIEKTQGSGVYSIVPRPPDAPEPLLVKTIFLDYTTVDEVTHVVQNMLPPNGSLSTFASRNALVIRSTEGNISEIELVLKTIDIQSKQVCIETKFMELTDEASKQLGIRWDSLEAFNVGFQAGPFTRTEAVNSGLTRNDSLTRSDSRYHIDSRDAIYDAYGNRVIDTGGGSEESEITLASQPAGLFEGSVGSFPGRRTIDAVDLTAVNESSISDTFSKSISENKAAILSVSSMDLVLSALKKTDGVSIISNPKLVVASGTTNAFFRVGQREPIIKTTIKRGTTDSPGDEITAELDTETTTEYIKSGYLHTGIELKVIPTVKAEELIEAEIIPSLRRKIDEKTVSGNTWPVISVKEINTLFTLRNNQTVAIGGLTDTSSSKKVSKVPLLGDLPLIGKYLFSHTQDVESQVETIIFVSLSLADPLQLDDNVGIPEQAELVHKKMIQSAARRARIVDEIRRIREATDQSEKVRSAVKSHSGIYEE